MCSLQVADQDIALQGLNTIRLYWQSNYTSYASVMDALALEVDANDPSLSQQFQDMELFKGLYEVSSFEDLDEKIGNGAEVAAGGASGGAAAAVTQAGNAVKNLPPIASATNNHTTIDVLIEMATPTNSNVPAGVQNVAKNVAKAAAVLGALPGILDYVNSGFDPDVGAMNATAYGVGAAAGLITGAVLAPLLVGVASAAVIAGIAGALVGGAAAAVVIAGWDAITTAAAETINTGVAVADAVAQAAAAVGEAVGEFFDAVGQAAVDAANAAVDMAGKLYDGFFDGLASLADWWAAVWEATGDAKWNGSPLVLDLDGDGIELISLEDSELYWDIDQDGLSEHSGWVASDDGLLAIDLNGDGLISGHEELFGSLDEDGFTALSVYDTNSDGVIDANDAQFGDLLVWKDDGDGITEAGELFSLSDLDIVSIDLNASTPSGLEIEGHNISHVSSYTVDDGVSGAQTLEIVDAWFNYDNANSNFIGDYTLDLDALFLTTMRGYGDLPDLHISASMDNDTTNPDSLKSLLQEFTANDFDGAFVDDGSNLQKVQDIMFRWADVDGVDPASRGLWVDARKLEFIENYG